ncbi:MAG: hypothetical protein NVS9B14_01560 [Candidatus Acidiferrum sp.]
MTLRNQILRTLFLLLALPPVWPIVLMAQTRPAPLREDQEVRVALDKFLAAFSNLDWPAFRSCFDDSATVFHPSAAHMRRTDTPAEFEAAWREVFERIKKQSGRSGPPYMDLKPADLSILLLSPDVALVTFHLPDSAVFGRRTVVLKKLSSHWKIVHIHASNFELSPPNDR